MNHKVVTTTMSLEDAMRVADIFEQDDVIAVPAKACRTLVTEIRRLQEQLAQFQSEV